jgi:hypothetical protein
VPTRWGGGGEEGANKMMKGRGEGSERAGRGESKEWHSAGCCSSMHEVTGSNPGDDTTLDKPHNHKVSGSIPCDHTIYQSEHRPWLGMWKPYSL